LSALPAAILFDFNGVIVDDEPIHGALFREALAEFGIALEKASYDARFIGLNDREGFRVALRDAGRAGEAEDDALIESIIQRKSARYCEIAARGAWLFAGARELIDWLAERRPLALVSGARRREIEFVLAREALRERFEIVVSGDDVSRSKPDPEGYLRGLAGLRARRRELSAVEPAGALAIEDSLAGVRAARAAGLRCFAVAHTFPAASLEDAGAEVCFEDLRGVLAALQGAGGPR
jgi:HAD superfamily hydrolase (TIGR01509 family)